MSDSSRTERTYHHELCRASSAGIIETAASTFLLLIALRWFGAGSWSKAFVAAGGSGGLLLSPLVVAVVTRAGVETSRSASRILAFGAVMFLIAAALPSLPVFVICSAMA